MNSTLHIRKMLPSELDWVNARYAEVDFLSSFDTDLIAIAEIDGVKVGMGRVVIVDQGIGELGGMLVLPEFRGQSIAGNIVEFLIANCGLSSLFCVPFTHLEDFYRRYGFSSIDASMPVPQEVADKFEWSKRFYPSSVVLLHRHL